jgi:hypothetical protein
MGTWPVTTTGSGAGGGVQSTHQDGCELLPQLCQLGFDVGCLRRAFAAPRTLVLNRLFDLLNPSLVFHDCRAVGALVWIRSPLDDVVALGGTFGKAC